MVRCCGTAGVCCGCAGCDDDDDDGDVSPTFFKASAIDTVGSLIGDAELAYLLGID